MNSRVTNVNISSKQWTQPIKGKSEKKKQGKTEDTKINRKNIRKRYAFWEMYTVKNLRQLEEE